MQSSFGNSDDHDGADAGSASALATRLGQKIARRQRRARWAKVLAVPTLGAAFYAARWSESAVVVGLVLFVIEIVLVLIGEAQRCPRCEAQLVTASGWKEVFEGTCPECGCVID
jgi:hypothetical protein